MCIAEIYIYLRLPYQLIEKDVYCRAVFSYVALFFTTDLHNFFIIQLIKIPSKEPFSKKIQTEKNIYNDDIYT